MSPHLSRSGRVSSPWRSPTLLPCQPRSMRMRDYARSSSFNRMRFARSAIEIAKASTSRSRELCFRRSGSKNPGERERWLLPAILRLLVHVLYGRLVDDEGGRAVAVDLDAALVVPLDNSVDLFAIAEYDDHRRFTL